MRQTPLGDAERQWFESKTQKITVGI